MVKHCSGYIGKILLLFLICSEFYISVITHKLHMISYNLMLLMANLVLGAGTIPLLFPES